MAICSSSFLSPLTNRRTDEYGGGSRARARFPLEVFEACRAAWPTASRCPCASRRRTGCRAASRATTPSVSRRCSRPHGATSSTSRPVRSGLIDAGVRPELPDAVRGPDRQEVGDSDDRGRGDLQLRGREHDHPRRPCRSLRPWTTAPLRPVSGRSTQLQHRTIACRGSLPIAPAAADPTTGRATSCVLPHACSGSGPRQIRRWRPGDAIEPVASAGTA